MKSYIQIALLLVFLHTGILSTAQVWNTVGSGIPSKVGNLYALSDGDHLYVADKNIVRKWNGMFWSALPPLPTSVYTIDDLAVLDSTLYVIAINGNTSTVDLYTFNGQAWSMSPIPGSMAVAMDVVQGSIYFSGIYNGAPAPVYTYDGSNFVAVGNVDQISYANNSNNFLEHNGALYAGMNGLSTTDPTAIRKYDAGSNAWELAVHFTQGTSTINDDFKLFEYSGDLWAVESGQDPAVYKVKDDTIFYHGKLPHTADAITEYEGDVMLSGSTVVFGGVTITRFDGNLFSSVAGPADAQASDTLNGEYYVFSKTQSNFNGFLYNYAYRISGSFSSLNGYTFQDLNSDCYRNSTEVELPNAIISLSGFSTASDRNGFYSFSMPAGSYSIDTAFLPSIVAKNFNMNCSLPLSITVGSQQSLTQDIGFTNNVPTDLQTFISPYSGWRARQGFNESYKVDVNNAGSSTASIVDVTIEVPSTVNISSINPTPSVSSGNTYTFSFLNIQPLETKTISFVAEIDTAQNNIGDTLIWRSSLGTISGDADLSDNGDTIIQRVVGAYDPNDKQASASQIAPGTDKVDYHIRFQNTGTDTAYKVTVVDTLDLSLPITRIVINSASHPYSLSVVNNILIWEFENIMLPDSGADYLGSQGYVRFSAGINSSMGVGDTIDNDAEIYFDYQDPVHTNHAKTAIVENVSLPEFYSKVNGLQVYPNPSSDVLYIKNVTDENIEVLLIDITGKVVEELELVGNGEETLEVNSLAKGVYFVKSKVGSFKVLVQD